MSEAEEPDDNEREGSSIPITLEVPAGLIRDYDEMIAAGIYLSREEALRHALVVSWRHDRGSWHTVRLDLLRDGDRPDTGRKRETEMDKPEADESANGGDERA